MALKTVHAARKGKWTAVVKWCVEWREYSVYFHLAGEGSTYFTTDKQDAIDTAESWVAAQHAKDA